MSESRFSFWEKCFLFLVILCLSYILYRLGGPKGDIRYHLIITGISKGHITPSISHVGPLQGKEMGGTAYMAALLEKTIGEFKGEPYSILSLGSEISGTPEAYFTKGTAIIESLNFLKIEAMLVGNIEFTFGQRVLEQLSTKARFPLLSSNVFLEGTEVSPSYIVSEKILYPSRNLRVGVLGITPPSTPDLTMKSNVSGLKFQPVGPEFAARVKSLRSRGVDLVIVMSQFNPNTLLPEDWIFIREARPDLFLMLDFSPEPIPVVLRDGVLVKSLSGYNHGKEIDVLDILVSDTPSRIPQFSSRRLAVDCGAIQPDQAVLKAQEQSLNQINNLKAKKIGEFAATIQRQYDRECLIGNLFCDALRDYGKCEIAFQNSGGIQGDVKAGPFTLGDLYDVLPFSNEIVTMELTGADIRELLTLSASQKRGILQVSGCSYAFSNRGVDDFELRSVSVSSGPLVLNRAYKIITNSFLADGGDEFKTFRKGKNVQYGPPQREIVQSYIEKLWASGPIQVATEGRIIRE